MGTRPLRQHYDGITSDIDRELCPTLGPWVRHRRRFLEELRALTDEQWRAPTRCTEWDVKDVVAHITSADGFWALSLGNARAGNEPTTFLTGFDPSSSLEPFVDAMRTNTPAEMLDGLEQSTNTLIALAYEFEDADWSTPAESPFGHLESRYIVAHAFWDSWLHERDIFVALGMPPPVDPEELQAVTIFTCFLGSVEGGLIGDPAPVGEGLEQPISVTLRFDDLPDALLVEVDKGVHIAKANAADGEPAGSAVELVERVGGRLPRVLDALPDDLAAQLGRAAQIL